MSYTCTANPCLTCTLCSRLPWRRKPFQNHSRRSRTVGGLPDLPLCTSQMVPCVSNLSHSGVIVKRVEGCVWNSCFHWRWTSATFSNLMYNFKIDFHSSNVNRAPAIFFHYHTSYVAWSYSHASSDICWENTILRIVMIIQFNFENNTQIPSVKVCMYFDVITSIVSFLWEYTTAARDVTF